MNQDQQTIIASLIITGIAVLWCGSAALGRFRKNGVLIVDILLGVLGIIALFVGVISSIILALSS